MRPGSGRHCSHYWPELSGIAPSHCKVGLENVGLLCVQEKHKLLLEAFSGHPFPTPASSPCYNRPQTGGLPHQSLEALRARTLFQHAPETVVLV